MRENTLPSSVPNYSVVIPANNEADNIGPLIGEICATLESQSFEIICVDDGSDDGTAETLGKLAKDIPELTFTRHAASAGQSSAIVSGVRQARAAVIITLDGDGQNDPADILALLARFNEAPD
ncbi:MAG: glycosyltransferase family 2 protein, partial [Rhodospirillales bacterium]|nr:glycosyltransferase family 2 protein [Rhodospirillales bacterium]